MNDKKLKGRDLINIGIYSAIYFVILMAIAMLGMIPIFLPLLSVLVPIIGGIPFMLYRDRQGLGREQQVLASSGL